MVVGLLWTSVVCHAQLDIQKAKGIVSAYLIEEKVNPAYRLYVYGDGMLDYVKIPVLGDTIIVQEAFVYFIDEYPSANWSHSARFLFVSEDGVLEEKKTVWPPDNIDNWNCMSGELKVSSGMLYDFSAMPQRKSLDRDMSHCHAVIISGGVEPSKNYVRYWNDCSAIYSVLVKLYGYLPENIHVLVSDGTSAGADRNLGDGRYDSSPLDLDGNGTPDIQYAATKSNITTVFDMLSRTLTREDNLFLFVTDHGAIGQDVYTMNTQYINLWNRETMSEDEFSDEVDKLKVGVLNVVLAQCYAGGIGGALQDEDRFIAAACTPLQNSYASIEGTYEEFVYQWVAAVSGHYPSGQAVNADANNDGYISMNEAFRFAQEHDRRKLYENPVRYEGYAGLGDALTLRGREICTERVFSTTVNSDKTVFGCDLDLKCTVKNGAKLNVEYQNTLTISSPFTMEAGTELDTRVVE